MIEIKITEEQIERAKNLYPFEELNNSITKGKSNIYGAIGEIVVNDFFIEKGHKVDHTQTFDYDIIIDDKKVDVKTKRTTVVPRDYYNATIDANSAHQHCDFYFFVRVLENLNRAWIIGYISQEDIIEKAVKNELGEKDTEKFNFKSECYNVTHDQLSRFKYDKPVVKKRKSYITLFNR